MHTYNLLPMFDDLWNIALSIPSFPCSANEIIYTAHSLGYGKPMLEFIQLFSTDQNSMFMSRIDFYSRSTELALLLNDDQTSIRYLECATVGNRG